jgi:two-component system, NarL family, nitrate/nitrite response regulator NarL
VHLWLRRLPGANVFLFDLFERAARVPDESAGIHGPIRVLLLDGHACFRQLLAAYLSSETGLSVVGQTDSIREAVEELARASVDLVVLNLNLGEPDVLDFLRIASESRPRARVLIIAMELGQKDAFRFLSRGASGIFLKHSPLEHLVEAIHEAAAGNIWIDSGVLPRPPAVDVPSELIGHLTRLDTRILTGIRDGLTNKELAALLDTSEGAVKAGLQRIFHKTGFRTRGKVARFALDHFEALK